MYTSRDLALGCDLALGDQEAHTGAPIAIEDTTGNSIPNVTDGTYVVFMTENSGALAYYAFVFVDAE